MKDYVARAEEIESRTDELIPRVVPADWREIDRYANAATWRSRDGIGVILEVENHEGKLWLHVSLSRRDRLPTWFDVRRVKDLFVGRERKAIQILPPESEYVNIHPFVLHLWSPLEHDPLPDFRHKGAL